MKNTLQFSTEHLHLYDCTFFFFLSIWTYTKFASEQSYKRRNLFYLWGSCCFYFATFNRGAIDRTDRTIQTINTSSHSGTVRKFLSKRATPLTPSTNTKTCSTAVKLFRHRSASQFYVRFTLINTCGARFIRKQKERLVTPSKYQAKTRQKLFR